MPHVFKFDPPRVPASGWVEARGPRTRAVQTFSFGPKLWHAQRAPSHDLNLVHLFNLFPEVVRLSMQVLFRCSDRNVTQRARAREAFIQSAAGHQTGESACSF